MNVGKDSFAVCKEGKEYTVRTQEEAYALLDLSVVKTVERLENDTEENDSSTEEFQIVLYTDYWIDAMVAKTELETGITREQFFRQKEAEMYE
jgi:hypothetical protein